MKRFLAAAIAILGIINVAFASPLPTTIPIADPKATFLETYSDGGATTTSPISLSGLGLTSGQTILLTEQGSFNYCCGQTTGMIALFSSSNTILDGSNLNRVPGAIAFPGSGLTTSTFFGPVNNSITQDFLVNTAVLGGTTVKIPTGANYLFVAAADSYYSDNSLAGSPNFGVSIALVPVPEPKSYAMLLAGLGLLGFIVYRRKDNSSDMPMAV